MSTRQTQTALETELLAAIDAIQTRHQLFPLSNELSDESEMPYTVVVAVSGGVDSVSLLHLLVQWAAPIQLQIHVAHLDHVLRPDSAADAHVVKTLATSYRLPYHHHRLASDELATASTSLETAARDARYAFLAKIAHQVTPPSQMPTIALAHHADDQAETVLHHLARGSGLRGLAGMKPVTKRTVALQHATNEEATIAEDAQVVVRLIRPLLYVRRSRLLQYATASGMTWREDPTNQDEQYTRNYLRHTIVPGLAEINAGVVNAIGRTAQLVAVETARLEAYDREQLAILQLPGASVAQERTVLDLDRLCELPMGTQQALLRLVLTDLSLTPLDLTLAQIETLCAVLQHANTGGPHPIVAELMWSVAGATATMPRRLSLHRADVLPFLPDQPLLMPGQRIVLPLPVNGTIETSVLSRGSHSALKIGDNWRLCLNWVTSQSLPSDWQRQLSPWQAYLDVSAFDRLTLTTPTTGQRIAPLGMAGQHQALGDLFTNAKVPVGLRTHWPLLVGVPRSASFSTSTEDVLWVCGLRVSHLVRVTAKSTEVLVLAFLQD